MMHVTRNDSQAQPNSTVGDTSERQVLEEAARSLQEWAQQLPAESPWREVFAGVAECFATGAELSRRRAAGAVRHAA